MKTSYLLSRKLGLAPAFNCLSVQYEIYVEHEAINIPIITKAIQAKNIHARTFNTTGKN
jgi:hypothetical protein